jgi:hypothetical protein
MPVVLRVGGFAFSIYHNDHDPPHVHVRYGGNGVVVDIVSREVRKIRGMTNADIGRAQLLVQGHCAELLVAWQQLHSEEER